MTAAPRSPGLLCRARRRTPSSGGADQPDGWSGAVLVPGTTAMVDGLGEQGRPTPFRPPCRARRAGRVSGPDATRGHGACARSCEQEHGSTRGARALRLRARPVAFATSYTLRPRRRRRAGGRPGAGSSRPSRPGWTRPAKRFRFAGIAVWVRWVAVRGGVEGELAPSSTACVRPAPPAEDARGPGSTRCRVLVVAGGVAVRRQRAEGAEKSGSWKCETGGRCGPRPSWITRSTLSALRSRRSPGGSSGRSWQ